MSWWDMTPHHVTLLKDSHMIKHLGVYRIHSTRNRLLPDSDTPWVLLSRPNRIVETRYHNRYIVIREAYQYTPADMLV
jgi:hypothetical protein